MPLLQADTHRYKMISSCVFAKEVYDRLCWADNVIEVESRMAAEDFARYSYLVPSVFYLLGTKNEAKEIT